MMKKILALMFIFGSVFSNSVVADPASTLVNLMNSSEQRKADVQAVGMAMIPFFRMILREEGYSPTDAQIEPLATVFADELIDDIQDEIETAMVQYLRRNFSEQELMEVIRFQTSDVGIKFLDKSAEMTLLGAEVGGEAGKRLGTKMQKNIKDYPRIVKAMEDLEQALRNQK